MLFPGQGPAAHVLFVSLGGPPAHRDPTTFQVPGALSCEGPDSTVMHRAANSRASSTAPADAGKKARLVDMLQC